MKYWLTLHWPFPIDVDPATREGVWLKDELRHAANELAIGDRILVYETKSGPKVRTSTGQIKNRRVGQMGIVACLEATSALVPVTEFPWDELLKWAWKIRTRPVATGFIPQRNCNRVLGYDENYQWRGFGRPHGSGLREISSDQFEELFSRLVVDS